MAINIENAFQTGNHIEIAPKQYTTRLGAVGGYIEDLQTKDNIVTSFSETLTDTKYPSERLVKESIDNLDNSFYRKDNSVDTMAIRNIVVNNPNIWATTQTFNTPVALGTLELKSIFRDVLFNVNGTNIKITEKSSGSFSPTSDHDIIYSSGVRDNTRYYFNGQATSAVTAQSCSGNANTATTAGTCSGNSATATLAHSCDGNSATATNADKWDGYHLSMGDFVLDANTICIL